METIVLFSRVELVHLYGSLNNYLAENFHIIHIAYSEKEERILKEQYSINEVINFKNEVAKIFIDQSINESLLKEIDDLFIKYTNGRFCLNSSIQNDRTFQKLPYKDCLLLAQTYYIFWDSFFKSHQAKFFIHELPALYFLHIASVICKKYNVKYLAQIQVRGESTFNWIFAEGDNGFPVEIDYFLQKEHSETDLERAKKFIEHFRLNKPAIYPAYQQKQKKEFQNNLLNFLYHSGKLSLRILKQKIKKSKALPDYSTLDHVELFLSGNIPTFKESLQRKYDEIYNLKYDTFDTSQHYFYYPMHVEPEAVVLYWGDGLYKNQVKLIENIVGQLPPNHFLYVKVHPLDKVTRDYLDYQRIKSIPNVKLLSPKTSGFNLIQYCKGLITINGTAGFEALMMNKPVYVFGNSIYNHCNRVTYVHHIRDLQKLLYENYTVDFIDDNQLFEFISAYLKSTHTGYALYFRNFAQLFNIDATENAKIVAQEMVKCFNII